MTVAVGCLVVGTLLGCTDERPDVAAPPTTQADDDAWFAFSPVHAMSEPPCGTDATPSRDGTACYELGRRLVGPRDIVAGRAVRLEVPADCPSDDLCLRTGPRNETDEPMETTWSVALTLSTDALRAFNAAAARCHARAPDCPSGEIAIVIDGAVVSAPTVSQPAYEANHFQIAGDYTEREARDLAARFPAA